MERPPGFFQGSELPRLLVLAVVMVVGWALVWHFAKKLPPARRARAHGDRETRADRAGSVRWSSRPSPTGRRSGSAITRPTPCCWSGHASKSPAELAAVSRRDVVLPHLLAEPPALSGRADPSARDRPARAPLSVQAEQDRLDLRGVDHHARRHEKSLSCACLKKPRTGLPIGADVSERVVFNGYFLKIWKYQAADVRRGAPLLVGRIGWEPREPAGADGKNSTLALVA